MRKQKTVSIEGLNYDLSQMGAVEGRALVVLFVKLLGKFAPVLASGAEALNAEALASLGSVLASVDAKELEPLWEAFAKHAFVRGRDGKTREALAEVFDEHFAGEYFAMVQFFVESSKLNFGDFLAKALASASAARATDQTP